jgi:hopanoid biosynthesis associated protein HpnK
VRTVVVTGDDFGASRGVNRAVVEAFDRGVLTHASLLVGGEAAPEAFALARARPGLAVGLHLAVLDARSVLKPAEIPRLVDGNGRFPRNAFAAGLLYQFSRAARRELRREIRAQLERFIESGLPLSHVDGHHHMHLHPVVLRILIDLAPTFGISFLRLPAEELGQALALDPRNPAGKALWSAIFWVLRRHGERTLGRAGIGFADRVYGLLATGRVTETYLLRLLSRIRTDRVEIYCHPAVAIPGEPSPDARAGGEAELTALLSPRVRSAIRDHGFVLARSPMSRSTNAS